MLFLASVLGSALLTLGLIIYFREHLKEQIGWYLLALCAIGAWAGWQSDGWIMLLMMPVVLWKVPPFSKEEKLFAWAASKDPLGIKAATAKFLQGKAWYWWLGYFILTCVIASILISLITGEQTLVIIG
jgi:hypothetical protein